MLRGRTQWGAVVDALAFLTVFGLVMTLSVDFLPRVAEPPIPHPNQLKMIFFENVFL